jgi:hypothetical protein
MWFHHGPGRVTSHLPCHRDLPFQGQGRKLGRKLTRNLTVMKLHTTTAFLDGVVVWLTLIVQCSTNPAGVMGQSGVMDHFEFLIQFLLNHHKNLHMTSCTTCKHIPCVFFFWVELCCIEKQKKCGLSHESRPMAAESELWLGTSVTDPLHPPMGPLPPQC